MIIAAAIASPVFCVIACLLAWRLRRLGEEFKNSQERQSGTNDAFQSLINNLYVLRIDDARERERLAGRIECLEYKTGHEGSLHSRISGVWDAIEELRRHEVSP